MSITLIPNPALGFTLQFYGIPPQSPVQALSLTLSLLSSLSAIDFILFYFILFDRFYFILFNWFYFIGWRCFWWLLWPELSNCVRTHITLMTFFTRLTRVKLCKFSLVPNSLYNQENEDEWGRLRKMRKTEILLLWFNYSRQFFIAPLKAMAATFILSSLFGVRL